MWLVRRYQSIEFSDNGLKLPFSECVFNGQGVAVLKRRNDIKLKTIALRKKLHLERTAA